MMSSQIGIRSFTRSVFRLTVALGIAASTSIDSSRAGDHEAAKSVQSGRNDAFESGATVKVHLVLSPEEYAAIQPQSAQKFPGFSFFTNPKPAEKDGEPARELHLNRFGMNLAWATGSAEINGDTFEKVGIRYKGNGTISDAAGSIKKSFKIDLDRFGGTLKFQGAKTINLHSGVADPSKYRETLGYAIYRAAGVPAPRTVFAEVWITVPGKFDHQLLGGYTMAESVDKSFLKNHFGNEKGLLMKPEGVREFEYKGDDWAAYAKQYLPKNEATSEQAARMIAFIRLVNKSDDAEFQKEIESFLDIDNYLRYLAVTSFVANADSFFALGHNYYLYLHPQTGKLHFIPWDLDRAFSNLPVLGSNKQQMDLSLTHPYGGTHRLTERLLAMPVVSDIYKQLLTDLSTSCFSLDSLLKRLEALEFQGGDLFARDAQAAVARGEGNGPPGAMVFGKPPSLKLFFEKRTASLLSQVSGESKGFVPSGAFRMGDMMASPLLQSLDSDQDGRLSKEEWIAIATKLFAASEKDSDGFVDAPSLGMGLNELFPKPAEGAPQGPKPGLFMAPSILKRADANKDNKLTPDELTAAAALLFDENDKSKMSSLDEGQFGELLNSLFPIPNVGPPPVKKPSEPKKNGKTEGINPKPDAQQ